jgi:8-oxo-dGTP diphosphatase
MSVINPHISADCVIFRHDERSLKVLLVERDPGNMHTGDDFHRLLKLPGGLVYNNELLKDAASRILKELTCIENVPLIQFDVLDSLDRMHEADRQWLEKVTGVQIDRVVSIAFYGIIDISRSQVCNTHSHWVELSQIHNLPFDHEDIIQRALKTIRTSLMRDGLLFDILPQKFTINQLQSLVSVFYDTEYDSRNFRKKLKKMDFIVPLEEKQTRVAHKPARLFTFDKEKFDNFNNTRVTF